MPVGVSRLRVGILWWQWGAVWAGVANASHHWPTSGCQVGMLTTMIAQSKISRFFALQRFIGQR
jgi:hypothetical protein